VGDDNEEPTDVENANALPSRAVDAVSQKLKQSYERILSEPVPDRFLDLLKQLEDSERTAHAASSASSDPSGKE